MTYSEARGTTPPRRCDLKQITCGESDPLLVADLANAGVSSEDIWFWLSTSGHAVSLDAVRWHRAGDCACVASPDSTP